MDSSTLVSEQIEAGAEFLHLFDPFAPVKTAFWLKLPEEPWALYVATDRINGTNIELGYAEVFRLSQQLRNPNFDVFQVKLIGADHPLACAALEIQQRYSGKGGIRYAAPFLGSVGVEGGYLYPVPVSACSE